MHITSCGKPTKVPLALCKKAVRYYGDVLLTNKINENVSVKLVFSREGLSKYKGNAICYDRKTFTIQVNPDVGERTILISLAHEMVHVKQWATGELVDYRTKPSVSKWKGKLYPSTEENANYWLKSPWEIDARGRELGLYYMFKEEPNYAVHSRRRR